LLLLELIQQFVEVLDKQFTNVSELDLIFNFHKTYFILDEIIIAGFVSESSRKTIDRELTNQK
jgi:AP-1 complex subunit sigma 1/2